MEEQVEKKKKSKGRKVLKGLLIAFGSLIGILVLLVAFSPLILETYINSESGNRKVNEIAGEYLNAKFDLGKINIKVWKNMPNVELELVNSEIISKAIKDDLTDTLLKFDTLRLSVNIKEFLENDSIIVNEAYLSHPIANAYINAEGKANWEIYESDTTPDEDTSSFDYKIRVKRLFIDNLKANYHDEASQMAASLDSTNIEITGEITAELIDIATKLNLKAKYDDGSSQILAKAEPTTITLNGNLTDGEYKLDTEFGLLSAEFIDSTSSTIINVDTINIGVIAKIIDSIYNIDTKLNLLLSEYKDNSLKFKNIPLDINLKGMANSDFNQFDIDTLSLTSNDIFVGLSGTAENLPDSSWNTDLAVGIDIPHIDNVLNMIPKSLVEDLKKYSISGAMNFNGTARGTYKDNTYPNVDANIVLNDVRAIVLEKNAEIKLDLETYLKYNAEKKYSSYINVKRLEASVGENFFDLKGKVNNILGDPYIDAKLNCNLNLDYISSLFPIEGITYRGKLSSDIDAKFSINDLTEMNLSDIYMLGNINIEKILLRIPSQRFFIFGKNALADVGINSLKMQKTNQTTLGKAMVSVDTVRITMPHVIDASISKLKIGSHANEPERNIANLGAHINLKGIQAIVADTMCISGKEGEVRLFVRPDTNDTLIPYITAKLKLDSVIYYEPTVGSFIDSTNITITAHPRIRKFRRENGVLVENDLSKRTVVDPDSLVRLVKSVEDAESALRHFRFDGEIHAKAVRYISPYIDTKMGTRRMNLTFTDDTLFLHNVMFRVGKSVVRINGQVDNMRRAFLRGRMLTANMNLYSKNIDINEILYVNYINSLEKKKYYDAKEFAQGKMSQDDWKKRIPEGLNDSLKAAFIDSLRREYHRKDFNEIFSERIGKMKELVEKIKNEEQAKSNDKEPQETEEQNYDTVPMSLITIPENLNCKVSLKFDTVKFAGLKMKEFNGDIMLQNSTLSIKDMKTESNVGDLKLNATYTCNNPDTAKAGLDLIGTNVTVENLLKAFPMIDSILPMLSSFEGNLDCELSAITDLDKEMMPVLPTLQTACHINGKNLVLLDGETFTTVAKYLMFKKKTKNVIDNMSVEFTIDKNMLSVYPFTLSMDKYKVAVSGRMDFDFKYFFHISVLEPKALPNLGINVQTKEPKKNKKDKDKDEEEEGELAEETDDFQFRLVKPMYKDEKSIAQSINLVNKSGLGRISLQQNLRKTIQNIIENYDEKKE